MPLKYGSLARLAKRTVLRSLSFIKITSRRRNRSWVGPAGVIRPPICHFGVKWLSLQPCLIPCGIDIEELLLEDDIGWVLIVEKEVRQASGTL